MRRREGNEETRFISLFFSLCSSPPHCYPTHILCHPAPGNSEEAPPEGDYNLYNRRSDAPHSPSAFFEEPLQGHERNSVPGCVRKVRERERLIALSLNQPLVAARDVGSLLPRLGELAHQKLASPGSYLGPSGLERSIND